MGLLIKNDHKFTPEEVQYLKDRCQYHLLKENEEKDFPKRPKKQKEDTRLKLDKDIYERVVGMTVLDLQSELRRVHIPPQGDENELKFLFAEYLQDERDAANK